MGDRILDAALEKRKALLKELEGVAAYRSLRELDQFIAVYHRLEREAPGQATQEPATSGQQVERGVRCAAPNEIKNTIESILRGNNNVPMRLGRLIEILTSRGIMLETTNPSRYLSSTLQRDGRFENHRKRWSLKNRERETGDTQGQSSPTGQMTPPGWA